MSDHTTTPPSTSAPPTSEAQGLGSIVGNIASDITTLVRQEAELAKTELREEVTKATKAASLFGGAGVAAHLGTLLVSLAVALGLAEWLDIDLGWTMLIVGALWLLIAAVTFAMGRQRMRTVDPVPHNTIKTLKEGF